MDLKVRKKWGFWRRKGELGSLWHAKFPDRRRGVGVGHLKLNFGQTSSFLPRRSTQRADDAENCHGLSDPSLLLFHPKFSLISHKVGRVTQETLNFKNLGIFT